jgi:ADP-ribose pyrophosphatase YjhB (NUDIX family)
MSMLDGWIACPRCRGDLETAEGRVSCRACGFVAYANPVPAASAVCLDERGRVLLARRARPPFAGAWDLPGGFVGEDEHPLDCLRRELREETGLEVEPLAFLGIWIDRYSEDDSGVVTLNLYWRARAGDGEPRPADDVSELGWFGEHELPPPGGLAFRTVGDALSAAWDADA